MTSPYVIHHEGTERFALPADRMWAEMTDVERFESWWQWLRDLELIDGGIVTGGGMTLSVVSPLPYKLRLRVYFDEVVEESSIDATVNGDLRGTAGLRIEPLDESSCRLHLVWDLEPTQAPVRVLVRAARPLIVRTKDWAIDIALRSFRRKVEGSRS